jgi:transposase
MSFASTPRPHLQTRVAARPHPSTQRGEAYSIDARVLVTGIRRFSNEIGGIDNLLTYLRERDIYPSPQTEARWRELDDQLGHMRRCRRNGNSFATRLRGADLIFLALYRVVYPKAAISEINGFLYRQNYGDPSWRFYHPSQISKAESLIGLSRKAGSTTAYQAFLPINIQLRWEYFNLPFPMGIADVRRSKVVDLDQCGIFVETANRGHGKAFVGLRVREPGPYTKTEKANLMLAICGEDETPGHPGSPGRRWSEIWLEGGTTIEKMMGFVAAIIEDLGEATPDNFYVFTMDNLSAHKNPGVTALIHAAGHGVVYRAPYYAVDGAIEYVFNTLQALLRNRLYQIRTLEDLVLAIHQSIGNMHNFAEYFRNVGFVIN